MVRRLTLDHSQAPKLCLSVCVCVCVIIRGGGMITWFRKAIFWSQLNERIVHLRLF